MMFKTLGMNVEIDFARVCMSECPASLVIDAFFGEDSDPTRQAFVFLSAFC
jgi:hypothetical protein